MRTDDNISCGPPCISVTRSLHNNNFMKLLFDGNTIGLRWNIKIDAACFNRPPTHIILFLSKNGRRQNNLFLLDIVSPLSIDFISLGNSFLWTTLINDVFANCISSALKLPIRRHQSPVLFVLREQLVLNRKQYATTLNNLPKYEYRFMIFISLAVVHRALISFIFVSALSSL